MLTRNNGVLKRAGDAKTETVIGQEKEQVQLAYSAALTKKWRYKKIVINDIAF